MPTTVDAHDEYQIDGKHPLILCSGDSLTQGAFSSDSAHAYPGVMDAMLKKAGYEYEGESASRAILASF